MIYIDQICKKNNLRYFLCGGTLLGAIRHKGFIPWDDDIDIMMPRPDFDRFLGIIKQANDRYKALSPGDKKYYYNFIKVVDSETMLVEHACQAIENMGVFIDVFPIDGMPSDSIVQKKHFNQLCKFKKKINDFCLLKPPLRKNLFAFAKSMLRYSKNKFQSLPRLQKKYEKLAKKYDYDDSDYVFMSGGAYGAKDIFPKSFVACCESKIFEKAQFSVMKEYDLYLTQLYGNYMKLPPAEKRITPHRFTATYRVNDQAEEIQPKNDSAI